MHLVKQAVKRFLRRRGWGPVAGPSVLADHPEYRYCPPLSLILSELFEQRNQCVFVQIGAFDGVKLDPLRPFLADPRWRGVLVEPQPEAFAKLEQHYGQEDRFQLVRAAITDYDGTVQLHTLGNSAIASLRPEHIHYHHRGRETPPIQILDVPCMTLDSLLRQCDFDAVDLLQIDAEGHDAVILDSLDLSQVRPKVLRYEHRHLTPADHNRCVQRLGEAGYRFVFDDMDATAVDCRPTAG